MAGLGPEPRCPRSSLGNPKRCFCALVRVGGQDHCLATPWGRFRSPGTGKRPALGHALGCRVRERKGGLEGAGRCSDATLSPLTCVFVPPGMEVAGVAPSVPPP